MTPEVLAEKERKIAAFDPDDVGQYNGKIFGLPFELEECRIAIIPVPWEATVSYRSGTANAPEEILRASPQLDLYDSRLPDPWKVGIGMAPIDPAWVEKNMLIRKKSMACIEILEHGGDRNNEALRLFTQSINEACAEIHGLVQKKAAALLAQDKLVAVLGGDHSTPLGLMRALADKYESYGILQIDAHADLRQAYQGFTYSHASIMYNAVQIGAVKRLVQVGIRDYCRGEAELIAQSQGRIRLFEDREIKRRQYEGISWRDVCGEIIESLPENVYVSFDIDGLAPWLCPNTGTPVPGGLLYEDVVYLLEQLVDSRRRIIGFDLCEVSTGESDNDWDAIVGARALYRLSTLAARSQGWV